MWLYKWSTTWKKYYFVRLFFLGTWFLKFQCGLYDEVPPELEDDDAAEHVRADEEGEDGQAAHVLLVAQRVAGRTEEHQHEDHNLAREGG